MHKDGFSRSVNISWSVFGDRPFIDIQFGPTFFDDTLYADKEFIRQHFQNLILIKSY